MFWANNYVSSPHIEALLNKEDVTLHELMDEDDILQECKSQNKKLIEYLTRPDVMEELVTLTTKEPSVELEERWRFKYPNVACELLTCDVPALNEKLAGDEMLLSKLYSFIDTDQPLNPLLASFFSKTIGVLVTRKSDQVLEFLRSRQGCVDLLLQHLETSAIMDLVLKLITQVEGSDMRQHILYWLDGQQLVQRLVKLLSPTSESERHANAAQLLCDMVRAERENRHTCSDPDPILNTLESSDTVSLLLQTILTGEKSESSIVGGIQVLLALLGQKTNTIINEGDNHGNDTSEDIPDTEQSMKISIATLPYMKHLHKLLLEPPYKPAIKTTAGLLECPLGNTRLHVAKLFMALLSTENTKIHEKLAELGTFQTLLDLFFKYSWNNFLHTQVERCLALAIKSDSQDTNDIIYANIFIKCKLIDRILEAWDKNENKQNEAKCIRQGYMGHLINIANNIVTQCEKNSSLESFLKANLSSECLNKWEALVTNQLDEINKAHQICLGGQPQAYMTNLDDYNSYSNGPYAQQAYANYQEQQITPPFIENYGLHDDEFNDADDVRHNSVDQLTTVAFTLTEEDLDKGEDMFNDMCQQKQRAGIEENNGGGGEWGDEGELTFQTVIDKRDWPSKQQHHDSSSSDDDEDPHDLHMEVDSADPWDSTESTSNSTILPKVNPWDVAPSQPVEQTGWANFDHFESTLSTEGVSEVNNKPCSDIKQETSKVPVSIVEKDKLPENKIDAEAVGSGDAGKIEDTEVTCSQFNETNVNSKIINPVNADTVHTTADNNANPSEFAGNRKLENSDMSKEIIKNSVESENVPANDNVKHALANLSTTSLATSKDSK